MDSSSIASAAPATVLPRIAINYCTQCRWMLRAAYFAQELLTTFSTAIGEVALIPATGGLFQVVLTYKPSMTSDVVGEQVTSENVVETKTVLLWDRKTEGGFPETKVLKQRVRDHIQPEKDLGHSDKHGKHGREEKRAEVVATQTKEEEAGQAQTKLEDCATCP